MTKEKKAAIQEKVAKLREAVKNYKRDLQEKRLRESSFEDLLKPVSRARQELVKAVADAGIISLSPEVLDTDKIDLNAVLGTSEEDFNPETGSLTESAMKALQEEKQVLKEESYQDIVNDYKANGGTDNYEDYKTWAANYKNSEKASILTRRNFLIYYKLSDAEPAAAAAPVNEEPPSQELMNLIDLVDAGESFTETAVDTVTTKYEMVELKLRRVIRGKSVKRYYLLAGDAGIGKTFIINSLLEEAGKLDTTPVVTGSIGRNPTTVAEFLWKYKDADLVILDDCDTFLRKDANPDVSNMLKGAMEPGTGYHVHITATIAKRLSTMIRESVELKEGEAPVADDLVLDDDWDDIEGLGEDDPAYIANDHQIPTDWTFNARLVIVSNLHENQINEALWSRCDHFDLHLTQEEYFVRLGMIIDKMDIGVKDGIYSAEDVQSAKDLVMSVLGPLIEAGKKGITMFGKRIQLKESLEFRLVKDVVDMWLSMVERYMEVHQGVSKDDAKKACLKKWVRVVVIPRISA